MFMISSAAMKRFLLVLLLAMLPIQIPWAAALAHCPQSANDGAHVSVPGDAFDAAHSHDTSDADDGHDAGAGPDCSVINLIALEPTAARAPSLPRTGTTAHDVAYSGHKSHIPDGLDRPNWDLAA